MHAKAATNGSSRTRFVGYETGGHLWVGHHEEMLANITAMVRDHWQ